MAGKLCPDCGQENPESAKHCVECGVRLPEAEAAASPRTPEPPPEPTQALRLPEINPNSLPEVQLPELPEVAPMAAPAQPSSDAELFQEIEALVEETGRLTDSAGSPAAADLFAAKSGSAPAADLPPVTSQPAPAAAPAPSATEEKPSAAAVYPPPMPKEEDDDRPNKKSRYAPMTSLGIALQMAVMSIPVVGFILMVVWSCGGCRKLARRNLARAYMILMVVAIVLAVAASLVLRFCYSEEITRAFEQVFPGYTIDWA